MRVKVYFNLHRKLFSVVSLEAHDRYGKVIDHVQKIALDNAGFVVRPAGRARVLREKRKNVHAFVTGTVSAIQDDYPGWADIVVYNPYKFSTFVLRDSHTPVHSAKKAWVQDRYVAALTNQEEVAAYEAALKNRFASVLDTLKL